jgi:DNA-binding MarR family transcriptional regulator
MTPTLQDRIKQTKPFDNLETEAYLNLVLLAQELTDGVMDVLKRADLSGPQYNVLRILRGAGEDGLNCGEIGRRMVHRVPDVTRLLDRLEARGFIQRQRESGDRRVVRVWITPEGLTTLAPLDRPLAEIHRQQLGRLGEKKLRSLIALLEEARSS